MTTKLRSFHGDMELALVCFRIESGHSIFVISSFWLLSFCRHNVGEEHFPESVSSNSKGTKRSWLIESNLTNIVIGNIPNLVFYISHLKKSTSKTAVDELRHVSVCRRLGWSRTWMSVFLPSAQAAGFIVIKHHNVYIDQIVPVIIKATWTQYSAASMAK